MIFDGWETKAQGKVPKVTMALLMCELSLNLASSLYVSVHTFRNPCAILEAYGPAAQTGLPLYH